MVLMLTLAAIVFVGCVNEKEDKSPVGGGVADVAYISLQVKTEKNEARSSGENAGMNESDLKTLYLITFDETEKVVGIPKTTEYYTKIENAASKPDAIKISAASEKLLVIANPGDKLLDVIENINDRTTFSTINAAVKEVQHGHKVVGNYFNAAFGQIADRLFVILDIALEIARAGLDMLVDGDALHDRPAKARVGDRLSAFFDLPDGPHLAVGNVMEGGHDVGGPGLTDVLKAYGVVRTVPAPGLFAKIHGCIVFRFSNFSHTVLSPLQAPHSFAVYDWCCLPPFRLAANRGMRPGGYATFWWQPTHAARAETACGLCRARRRKTSVAKLKAPKPSACRFRGNNLRPACPERAQQEQDYAASRSGHAGCRLFLFRCKR